MVYFNINQLFISILLFAGLNQAFEPRCRTWPKNQNGTIITKDGAFYIRCEYQGTSPDGHECQFRHFDKKNRTLKEFIHQMQLEMSLELILGTPGRTLYT